MKPLRFSLAALLTSLLTSLPCIASDSYITTLPKRYVPLARAVEKAGVVIKLSKSRDACFGNHGLYYGSDRSIMICDPTFPIWGPISLDTLVHESHHVLQDCRGGDGLGGLTGLFFSSMKDFMVFVTSSLTPLERAQIIEAYGGPNVPHELIFLELEAFAVAKSILPEKVAESITAACPIL